MPPESLKQKFPRARLRRDMPHLLSSKRVLSDTDAVKYVVWACRGGVGTYTVYETL